MTYFSLAEARKLLPEIRDITKTYFEQVHELTELLKDVDEDQSHKIENQIEVLVKTWVIKILDYGVEIKGLWLVDFDSGDGYYYCWKYNEDDILYFHRYETGYAGRRPIHLLEN